MRNRSSASISAVQLSWPLGFLPLSSDSLETGVCIRVETLHVDGVSTTPLRECRAVVAIADDILQLINSQIGDESSPPSTCQDSRTSLEHQPAEQARTH